MGDDKGTGLWIARPMLLAAAAACAVAGAGSLLWPESACPAADGPASGALPPLSTGMSHLRIPVGAEQVVDVRVGDAVDVWTSPQNCAEYPCPAILLTAGATVASVTGGDSGLIGGETGSHVGLRVRDADVGTILGHVGADPIALVVTAPAVSAS